MQVTRTQPKEHLLVLLDQVDSGLRGDRAKAVLSYHECLSNSSIPKGKLPPKFEEYYPEYQQMNPNFAGFVEEKDPDTGQITLRLKTEKDKFIESLKEGGEYDRISGELIV